MKFIIITPDYPSKDRLYASGFIHRRVIEYLKKGYEVQVYVIRKNNNNSIYNYEHEDVKITVGNKNNLINFIKEFNPDKLLIHFINKSIIDVLYRTEFKYESIIWVHGVEALGWYRRLFNINIKFIKYIIVNTIDMLVLRRFIYKSKNKNVKFIFVSKWMKEIMEMDTGTKIDNYSVIPNVIDTDIFKFKDKSIELRKNVLMIRPFNGSKKYANDIAIKALIHASKYEFFKNLNITIIGKGKSFNKLVKPLRNFKNIELKETFLNHKEICEYHELNGILLCPTRQDSQGVSMCEGMSSGLIPITSNNTAIPEFVEDNISGFLTNDYIEISNKLEYLYNNPDMFKKISKTASDNIQMKCSSDITILKELEAIGV